MVRWRLLIPALDDHAVAGAGFSVANAAVDVETLLPTAKSGEIDGDGNLVNQLLIFATRLQRRIWKGRLKGHGSGGDGASGAVIIEELARFERLVSRLIVHVAMATCGECEKREDASGCCVPHAAAIRRTRVAVNWFHCKNAFCVASDFYYSDFRSANRLKKLSRFAGVKLWVGRLDAQEKTILRRETEIGNFE